MSPKTTPMAPSARAAALFLVGVVVSTDLGLNLLFDARVVAPAKLVGGAVQIEGRYLGRYCPHDKRRTRPGFRWFRATN
jgi:hypothetical protein